MMFDNRFIFPPIDAPRRVLDCGFGTGEVRSLRSSCSPVDFAFGRGFWTQEPYRLWLEAVALPDCTPLVLRIALNVDSYNSGLFRWPGNILGARSVQPSFFMHVVVIVIEIGVLGAHCNTSIPLFRHRSSFLVVYEEAAWAKPTSAKERPS